MAGVAQGLAEASYQLEMENWRQWEQDAYNLRMENEFRRGMYKSMYGHQYRYNRYSSNSYQNNQEYRKSYNMYSQENDAYQQWRN